MERETSHAVVHGVTKSQTQLSNWTTDWLNNDNKDVCHLPCGFGTVCFCSCQLSTPHDVNSGWKMRHPVYKEAVEQVFRQANIISRGWFHNPSLCISSYLEHQVLVTSRKLLQCKCLTSLNYPFTKILQVDLPTLPLWSSLSELSEVLSPRVQSSFCPQIKFNLHLSHHAFFFSVNTIHHSHDFNLMIPSYVSVGEPSI